MAVQIPLNNIPNQTINITLDDVLYEITIQTINPHCVISIKADGETLISSFPLVPKQGLLPAYKKVGGQFYLASLTEEYPSYTDFEENCALIYVSDSESE